MAPGARLSVCWHRRRHPGDHGAARFAQDHDPADTGDIERIAARHGAGLDRASQPGIVTLGYAAPGVVPDAGDFTLVRDPSELVAAVISPLAVS